MFINHIRLAVTAFADESGLGSIYASKSETDYLLSAAKASDSVLSKSLSEYKIYIDEKTLMPIYYSSLLDYAESGSLKYQAYLLDGKQMYASDMLDSSGKFDGTAVLSEYDVLMYKESSDKNDSLDFLSANAKRISSLTGSKIESLGSKAKFMFLEGAGYVYYIETDSKTVLISTNLKGANGDLFNSENKGMVAVDENLLSFAKELFKKANEEKAALANLASGENPPTGAAVPAYFADNSEYNNNNTSSKVLPQALLAAAAVGTIVFILTNKAEKAKIIERRSQICAGKAAVSYETAVLFYNYSYKSPTIFPKRIKLSETNKKCPCRSKGTANSIFPSLWRSLRRGAYGFVLPKDRAPKNG